MGVVVRRYIDILTIMINFPYSTCISSFFGSSIPTSLFIFKMFFRSCFCYFIYITERDRRREVGGREGEENRKGMRGEEKGKEGKKR